MKPKIIVTVIALVCCLSAMAQLNKYSIGFDLNPMANGTSAVINLSLLSTKNKLPLKLNACFAGPSLPEKGYQYSFLYLEPGFVIKLDENIAEKNLFYLSLNLNIAYLQHNFTTTLVDDFGTKRIFTINPNVLVLGYEIELGWFNNIGKTMFNIHYGISLGAPFLNHKVMDKYFKVNKSPINYQSPGIGSGNAITGSLFLGFGTRL
ncbi:MAG: hypothetical protein KBE91_03565 [Bacteroidia bacterium]|nr:hypothetical protein [Bacteroidia bacterium]MBP9688663.1 hypothetical protein [Bacteroidia bacterium]